ncbi:MAG: hypothetical protein Q7J80_02530 [Anaerolineales bacterium]|nr:hypothetical protein [Anaerolineales bacterium]
MQQFQDDLMEAVCDMKAGRAARTHHVPLTPAADARAHAGLSQSQFCRASGGVGAHLAGLGARPQTTVRRSTHAD